MESIIDKIDRHRLIAELTADIFIRPTNNIGNDIYIFDGNNKPSLMKEVGRLREVSFRMSGGGSGNSADIDEFDLGPHAYKQLIVWNPKDEEIVGGYRFILCKDAKLDNGDFHLSTTEIFKYSDTLKTQYLPHTIELGRSFVQPEYQPSAENRKGLFSLDNLWDGLGALVVIYPEIKYFFGKVTMYSDFNVKARDTILCFMHQYFPDNDSLITIPSQLTPTTDCTEFLDSLNGLTYKEGHHVLNQLVRSLGENIPPLFNSYMNLSPTMKTFGTAINHHFGDVEETGIMVTIADIYSSKKDRHIQSFLEYLNKSNHQTLS